MFCNTFPSSMYGQHVGSFTRYSLAKLMDNLARFGLVPILCISFLATATASTPTPRRILQTFGPANPRLDNATCLAWIDEDTNGVAIRCNDNQGQAIGSIVCNGNEASAGCNTVDINLPANAIPIEQFFLNELQGLQNEGATDEIARFLQILAAIPTEQASGLLNTRLVALASMQQLRGSALFLQLRNTLEALPVDPLRTAICHHWLILLPESAGQTTPSSFSREERWDALSDSCNFILRNPESFAYRLSLLGAESSDLHTVGLVLTESADPFFANSICPYPDVCLSPFRPGCVVNNLAAVSAAANLDVLEAAHAAQVIGQQNPVLGYFEQIFVCDTPELKPLISEPFQCVPLAQAADRWYQAVFRLNQIAPNVLLPNFAWQINTPFSLDTIGFVQVLAEQLLAEGNAENMQRWIRDKQALWASANVPADIDAFAVQALTNLAQSLLWLTEQPAPTLYNSEQNCNCPPLTEQNLLATCHPSYGSPAPGSSPSDPQPSPLSSSPSPTVSPTPTHLPAPVSPSVVPSPKQPIPSPSPSVRSPSPAIISSPASNPSPDVRRSPAPRPPIVLSPTVGPTTPPNSPPVLSPDVRRSPGQRSPTARAPSPAPAVTSPSSPPSKSPAPAPSSPSKSPTPVPSSPSKSPTPAPSSPSKSPAPAPSSPSKSPAPAPNNL